MSNFAFMIRRAHIRGPPTISDKEEKITASAIISLGGNDIS